MKCRTWFGLVALAGIVAAAPLLADEPEKAHEVVKADNCKNFELQLDFSAGVLEVIPADIADFLDAEIYFTPRSVRYNVEKNDRADRCVVYVESERRRSWSDDESDNEWTVQLSRRYPTSIEMNINACEARVDLGGIPITDLSLDVAAADVAIDFSSPNPSKIRDLTVDCGASSLEITGLAGANARSMNFDVGAGSCEIDLRGEIEGEIEIDASVGVGSMDIILSKDVALMVEGDDGWFSNIDFHGLDLEKSRRGAWETENFNKATNRVVITAEVAMGSISIYGKR